MQLSLNLLVWQAVVFASLCLATLTTEEKSPNGPPRDIPCMEKPGPMLTTYLQNFTLSAYRLESSAAAPFQLQLAPTGTNRYQFGLFDNRSSLFMLQNGQLAGHGVNFNNVESEVMCSMRNVTNSPMMSVDPLCGDVQTSQLEITKSWVAEPYCYFGNTWYILLPVLGPNIKFAAPPNYFKFLNLTISEYKGQVVGAVQDPELAQLGPTEIILKINDA